MRRILATAILAAAAAVMLAACGPNHASGQPVQVLSPAHSAASSALANPTVSADLTAGELALQANLQKHWDPAHPVKSVQAAVQATFPRGNTAQIEGFAVQHFTLAVITTKGPGSARETWLQAVYGDALTQGGYTPAATPAPGTTGTVA